jgi:heme exporter protein C
MKKFLFTILALACVAGFAASLYLVFYVAPLQGMEGNVATPLFFNQKIFYYHVPCAFMLFLAVFVCGFASAMFLVSKRGRWDDVALAAGDVAVLFGAIVLVTGAIWGKVAWGKWWDWDVRLTTSLLLWVMMLAYALVRKYGGPGSERLGAGMAIFATVNVPLVYYSVRLWRTLHPQTSVVPGLQGDQRTAFWLSVGVFFLFFFLLIRHRIELARNERRLREIREEALDAGIF